jgi:hypothetical protein
MKRLYALLIAGLPATIATAQAPRVRDSAGVRIVENGPRLTAPITFALADKPSFDAGGLQSNPADEFIANNYYLKGARLSDGRVVIIDRTRVYFYDPSGKRLRTVGREGRGPGEYEHAQDVCIARGDTVLIGQTRGLITRLTGTGDFIDAAPPVGGYPEGQFCFGDGTVATLNRLSTDYTKSNPFRVNRQSLTRYLNTVAEFAYPPFDMLIIGEVGQAARGDRFYVAEPTTFEIKGYGINGKLELIVRTADPLVTISASAREALAPSGQRKGATAAEVEAARRDAIAKSTTKYWPTLNKFMVDPSGRIWVREWSARQEPTKPSNWAAFDSTGRLLGRLVIPASPSREERSEVMGFGTNEVFFKRYDADGAPHLTIVPIQAVKR